MRVELSGRRVVVAAGRATPGGIRSQLSLRWQPSSEAYLKSKFSRVVVAAGLAAASAVGCSAGDDRQPPQEVPDRTGDIVAIHQVLQAHQIWIDERDPDAYARLYAEHGTYESDFGGGSGFEEIRAMSEHLHAIGLTDGKRHLTGPALIEFDGPDTATSLSYWWVVDVASPPSIFATGVYRDRLERLGGEWKFVSRILEADQTTAPSDEAGPRP